MKMEKFESAIKNRIVDQALLKRSTPSLGMITDYKPETNMATVQMTRQGSNQPGETLKNVACPIIPGLQFVAPEVGRLCWVSFRDGTYNQPMIVAYYSPNHAQLDYDKQYDTKSDLPKHLTHTSGRRDSRFGRKEVGLTHPDTSAFVRLTDSGEIEITASESLSIVMNPKNDSITFIADSINFMTKDEQGLNWNDLEFNSKATTFQEPTLVDKDSSLNRSLYRGVDYFLEEDEDG